MLVTAASVQGSAAGALLLGQVATDHPTVRKVWVDYGSKRWAVERTYGWLMVHRRLARDCESLPARSEAMIQLAIADLMARRLTDESTISRRDPAKPHQLQNPG